MTDEITARVAAWQAEGVIGFEQAERLTTPQPPPRRAPEWLAYLGAALVLTGGLLVANQLLTTARFEKPNEWGAFAVLAAASLGVAVAAAWMLVGATPPARRGAGAALLGAVLAGAAAFAVLFGTIAEADDSTILLIGLATAVYGYLAWRLHPTAPTQVALAVGIVTAIVGLVVYVITDTGNIALIAFDLEDLGTWTGLLITVFGGIWIRLGIVGKMRPANTAFTLGSLAVIAGTFILYSVTTGWMFGQALAAAALIATGAARRRSVLLAAGAAGAVLAAVEIAVETFDDPGAGAGWALAVAGALALTMAVQRARSNT